MQDFNSTEQFRGFLPAATLHKDRAAQEPLQEDFLDFRFCTVASSFWVAQKGGVNLGGWKGLGASKTTVRL